MTQGKSLPAFRACEWALAGMFAEVVAQIAALFEDLTTVRVATFEINFTTLGVMVPHLDNLRPRLRNTLKGL